MVTFLLIYSHLTSIPLHNTGKIILATLLQCLIPSQPNLSFASIVLSSKACPARLIPAPSLLSPQNALVPQGCWRLLPWALAHAVPAIMNALPHQLPFPVIPSQHVELNSKITSSGKPSLTFQNRVSWPQCLILQHPELYQEDHLLVYSYIFPWIASPMKTGTMFVSSVWCIVGAQ